MYSKHSSIIKIPTNMCALKQSKDKRVLMDIKNDVRLNVNSIILPGLVDKISACSYSNTRIFAMDNG